MCGVVGARSRQFLPKHKVGADLLHPRHNKIEGANETAVREWKNVTQNASTVRLSFHERTEGNFTLTLSWASDTLRSAYSPLNLGMCRQRSWASAMVIRPPSTVHVASRGRYRHQRQR